MKKILSLMLVLILGLTLVACNNDTTEEANETATDTVAEVEETAEETETTEETEETTEVAEGSNNKLQTIQDSGKLVVGTSADYPPYEFHAVIDGQDQIVGFDIEFARAIAEELGVELEIQDMDFSAVLAGVQNGIIDLGVAGINPTPDRQEVMDFTDIYFKSEYCILVNADDVDNYTTEEDLNGKAVGVQLGTIQETMVNENLEPSNTVALGKITDLVMQLKSGMIDAIVIEVPVADSYAKANPDLATVNELTFEDYDMEGGSAAVAQKGEVEFVEKINEIIAKLQEEGKFEEWYADAVELADTLNTEE